MRLRVDLYPHRPAPRDVSGSSPEVHPGGAYDAADVVVLIDVLRSCTVAPILFDNGLADLYFCASIAGAKKFASDRGALLLGERRGLPPEGFNYGNSPAELRSLEAHGRQAVLVSENTPQVLPLLAEARHVLLGSLYNADAVFRCAYALAGEQITLVCSGFAGTESLDDALAAGYMAARLKQFYPDIRLEGAALMAISLLKAFPEPLEALWHSHAGYYLRNVQIQEDIAIASLISQSDKVPRLQGVIGTDTAPLYHFRADTNGPNDG